jgi:hypothetical protein
MIYKSRFEIEAKIRMSNKVIGDIYKNKNSILMKQINLDSSIIHIYKTVKCFLAFGNSQYTYEASSLFGKTIDIHRDKYNHISGEKMLLFERWFV